MLQTYARNKLTWPLSVGFTFVTWIFNGCFSLGGKLPHTVLVSPFFDYALGMLVCIVAIYLIAELNTRYALLSNTDRTISMTFMLLIAMAMFLHPLQKAHLVMICYLVSYMLLFETYQSKKSPIWAFSVNLSLGVSSLVCPQLVWLVILNCLSLLILRSIGLKTLVASVLGILVPYWFWGILSYAFGGEGAFAAHIDMMNTFGGAGFDILSGKERWSFWTVLIIFIVGGIDFFVNIHQNRSRTRINYYVVCLQGLVIFFFVWAEPELFSCLFPLCMVNASIVWGRLCSFSKGRTYDIIWTVVAVMWFITTLFIS